MKAIPLNSEECSLLYAACRELHGTRASESDLFKTKRVKDECLKESAQYRKLAVKLAGARAAMIVAD